MCNGTLVRRCVTLTTLAWALAVPADAQNAAGRTEAFCALAGLDLLAALDGSWTIRQEAGQARAGAMMVPLPAPPPAQITFRNDPRQRLIDVRGANLSDGMIMFPVAPVQQAHANGLVGTPPAAIQSGSICAWLDSPTLIGTNDYFFFDGNFYFKAQQMQSCDELAAVIADPNGPEAQKWQKILGSPDPSYLVQWAQRFRKESCNRQSMNADLEMQTTLVLRFTSANSGTGTVYFEGKTDRSAFRGSAPVRISR